MPNFTDNRIDRAYESFMQQVPGFHRDPPEAEVIQRDLERNKRKGASKPGTRQSRGGYAKYIATREGVEKLDDSQKFAPATVKQRKLIGKLLRDFPDCKDMFEYEDYLREQTVGTASEFIARAIEDNAGRALTSKTYADYIATRPRAERFGSHGLFTDEGVKVDLEKVSAELNDFDGNVYTIIISLRREDAERLGFDTGSRWRDMLRTQTQALAENLRIPMEHLKWFAAFHNESHHPHVHLIAYSNSGNEGYLSKTGVQKLRSAFARDIFAQELHCIYERQTEYRDQLRVQSKEKVAELVAQIKSGLTYDPQLKQMLLTLAERLKRHKGKKVYGYLSAGTKKLVDDIVDLLAKDNRISALYDLWYQQRDEIFKTYSRDLSERLPLSQNSELKPIRNAVVQEAVKLLGAEHGQENRHSEYSPSIMPQALTLLQDTAQIFQERFRDLEDQRMRRVDRKLQSRIAEKKLAQGQKLGG